MYILKTSATVTIKISVKNIKKRSIKNRNEKCTELLNLKNAKKAAAKMLTFFHILVKYYSIKCFGLSM